MISLLLALVHTTGTTPEPSALWSTSALLVSGQAQESSARARVAAFLKALNEQTPEAIRNMLQEHSVVDNPAAPPLEKRVESLLGIAKEYGPFTLVEVLEEKPRQILARIRDRSGQDVGILMMLAPDKDSRFLGVRIGGIEELRGGVTGPPPITGWKTLGELADKVLDATKSPAVAVAVVKDGKLQEAVRGTREAGKSDPATPSDRWTVGSIGKSFTGTLAAMMVDKGLVRWDTTVGEALGDIPMREEYKPVTLIQLLTHRGGIPQDMGFRMPDIQRMIGEETEAVKVRERYARDILNREPIVPRGTEMRYSNAGFALASIILERAAKKPFDQAMKQFVFEPLGLSSALYATPGTPGAPGSAGQPAGHRPGNGTLTAVHAMEPRLGKMFAGAGGGLSMTIGDLARYAQWHLEGLRGNVTKIGKANFERMHTPAEGPGERYGTGWAVAADMIPGTTFHHHNGGDGTFHADMGVFPKENLVVVAVGNLGNEGPATASTVAMINAYRELSKH